MQRTEVYLLNTCTARLAICTPTWWAGVLSSAEGEQKLGACIQAESVLGSLAFSSHRPASLVEAVRMCMSLYMSVRLCPRNRLCALKLRFPVLLCLVFGCWLYVALQTQGKVTVFQWYLIPRVVFSLALKRKVTWATGTFAMSTWVLNSFCLRKRLFKYLGLSQHGLGCACR